MIDGAEVLAQQLEELERRLRMLEGGARVGLGGLRSAWGTAAGDHVPGAYNSGPGSSTWLADDGSSGTGYPALTIPECPSRYMIFWSVRPINIGNSASWRSNQGEITVAINGVDIPTLPNARRGFANLNLQSADTTMSMIVARRELPSTKTFQMRASLQDTVPAAPNQPRLTDIYMGVLPLAVA